MKHMRGAFACIAAFTALAVEAGMRDLQSEIDEAAELGGGVVRIGPGEHEAKPFSMKSNVTLELAEGATILASTNIADYAAAFGKRCFIYAEGATNIAIVGSGTIDGRGYAFKELKNLPGASQPQALPVMMRFSRCRNVRLEGFTYRQAGAWGCHLRNCDGATLRRLKCFNHVNNTNDGIDIESANVTIEDCDIDSDDDAIAFKTESDKSFAVTNVTIRNCRIASCCSAVKFGTGSYSDVRDVKIENCSLVRSKLNHRFKWWKIIPGVETNSVTGLAGLALEVVDGGRMENVTVRNLTMDGYHVPIFVRMNRRHPPPQGMKTYLRNILIENVRGTSSSRIACSITGIPGMRPSNITIRNVRLAFLGGGTAADAAAVVPEKEKAYPECCMFDKMPLPAYAFYVRHADSVVFEDVDVWTMQPDERKPFVFDDCTDCARRNTSTGAKRFSIGTYCLPKGMTEDQVADLKACGIDTVFFAKDSAAVQPILAKYGIREVMRSVDYIRKPHLVKNLETDGRRLRTEIDAGHHPAFGGLDVYDEPNAAILPRIGDVATRLQTATGGLPMYVNLYPEYVFGASKSVSEEKKRNFGANSYDEYIDLYCRNVPLDHISYDFYLYSLSPSALPKFYDNFRIVADACRRTGRSLRFVGQVNSANPKVWISENMLRYQAFTAMAFGAEAVSWGCWSAGWYTNQVLDAQGRKTQQYDKLKKVDGEILTIASEYMRFRNVATSFAGFPKGCYDLKGIPDEPVAWFDDDFVRGLSAEDGDRLVVGAMLPRSGNAAERAYFVLAADDPYDKAPRERTVRFELPDGLSAKVVGGSGIVAPAKAADGTLRFPLASSAGALIVVSKCEGGNVRDLWSDTWDAIDGLGRVTERADLPAPRVKKVGIFYWTWHQGGFAGEAPFNNAKFLAENPGIEGKRDDPRWGRTWRRHHWDEPLFGYYRTTDKWVLRRHAQMLSAAGVDTVVFDSTNATYTWLDSLHALGETWCEMRREGNSTPQFAYMLPFGKKPTQIVMLLELYRKIYKPGKFKELWFEWNGKPLVHARPQVLEAAIADAATSEEDRRDLKEILGFFTFRPLQPSYTAGPQSDDQWTWLEVYPQHPCGPKADGGYEMCSAGVAQNHTWKGRDGHKGIAAMNDINVLGRAYVAPDEKDLAPGEKLYFAADRNPRRGEPNRFLWGDNFAQQTQRAREIDPDYLFVTGWNEWIADMMPKWNGIKNAFPDQFSPEFSRDIEPSAGVLKDHYYCQLVQELRQFRGSRRQRASDEQPIYRDAIGDTAARDSAGYWKIRYTDKSGRNDIVECFVSHDTENVTFRVECAAPITPHADKSWMRLFVSVALDPDDRRPNWEHFHFAANRVSPPDGRTAVLESCEGGWKWREVARVPMKVEGKSLTLVLPRKALGLDKGKVNLWFKWSDNSIGENGDVLDFYRRGDAAPDGRFLYRYFERVTESCEPKGSASRPVASNRMDRSRLLIGAYCLQENARTEGHVRDIRDCGVDFIVGTGKNGIFADDRATLDLFAKYGLGAIVEGVAPVWNGWDGRDAGKMRELHPLEEYAALAAKFKDHPAIWAIDIGDEPSALDFPYFGEIVRFYNKALPGMPLYLNLYPNYASVSQNTGAQTVNQLGTSTYAEHVEAYCRDVPIDYISYDFYPYMSQVDTDRFLSKMYDNFIVVADACRRTNRSFWYIPQVNSRPGLSATSMNRLRFQANSALSFGVETIMWGCWCKGWWTNNVLDAAGCKTEQYEKLRCVNAELRRIGAEYMKFKNVATCFVGFPESAAWNPKEKSVRVDKLDFGPFGDLRASNGAPLLVGEMVSRDTAELTRAVFVTAADDPCDEHPATFEILFRAKGVRAFGGGGRIPVRILGDSTCAVRISSCGGVLLVADGARGCSRKSNLPNAGHRPETWFHVIGGNASKEGMTADLEALKDAGFGGIQFFHGQLGKAEAWDGVAEQIPCLSPKWDDLVRHAADECVRLGMTFKMQNCPGWSMSGGPWIAPSNAMRKLVYARSDVHSGGVGTRRPTIPDIQIPEEYRDADSDWQDVCYLVFPTPDGGAADEDVRPPDSVETNGNVRTFHFEKPVTIRTLELPSPSQLNHVWSYNPDAHVLFEAKTESGWMAVCDVDYPQGCWQDKVPFSVACEDCEAKTWRLTLTAPHPVGLPFVRLNQSARLDNWEGKAGHVLRGLMKRPAPRQDAAAYVPRDAVRVVRPGDVLEGNWTVLRVGHVNMKKKNAPAPKEATGWECDKLDPRGIEANFAGYIGRLADGPLAGGKLKGMIVDSWECERQTWTWRMSEWFREANGYDVKPILPAVFGWILDSPAETEKILLDWRRTVSGLITKNYYARMAELAHGKGLSVAYETAFGDVVPGDILEYWKYCDTPMCEFWQPYAPEKGGAGHPNFKPVRPCVSAAHLYGKRRVDCESFTSMALDWDENFRTLKEQAVRHFARGVTHLVFHTCTHNPQTDGRAPGTSFGSYIGTPFIRGQTWWPFMRSFTDWTAECCSFLERGKPVVDVLRYLGDDLDHKPDEFEYFPEGFKSDYLNADVLFNRLDVKDGCFVLPDGMSYAAIWVPPSVAVAPATRARLGELAAKGGHVVYGTADEAVVGMKPQIVSPSPLLWYHRRDGDEDLFFVAADEKGFKGEATFSTQRGEKTLLLDLAPFETRLLDYTPAGLFFSTGLTGFTRLKDERNPVNLVNPVKETASVLLDSWTLSFPSGWGAPERLKLNHLVPWKDLPGVSDEGRAFSGTATYTTNVELKNGECVEGQRVLIDLGEVRDFAHVFVNGREAAVLWAEPYRCDIAPFTKPGENEIRIEVTSTWFNRLAYDFAQPPEKRKTWTVWNVGGRTPPCLVPDEALRPSGLLGPVRSFSMGKSTRCEEFRN